MIQRIIVTANVAKRIIPQYKMMAAIENDHQSQKNNKIMVAIITAVVLFLCVPVGAVIYTILTFDIKRN